MVKAMVKSGGGSGGGAANEPEIHGGGGRGEMRGDRIHLRRTTEQHVPEAEVQVKRRRTASLSNQECQQCPRRSQQQVPVVVDFQAELRQAFLAETPRGG